MYDSGSVQAISYTEVNVHLVSGGLTNNQVCTVAKGRQAAADTWVVRVKFTDATGFNFSFFVYNDGSLVGVGTSATGQTADALTAQLYAANDVGVAWYLMGAVGIVAAAGMYVYGRWTYQLKD